MCRVAATRLRCIRVLRVGQSAAPRFRSRDPFDDRPARTRGLLRPCSRRPANGETSIARSGAERGTRSGFTNVVFPNVRKTSSATLRRERPSKRPSVTSGVAPGRRREQRFPQRGESQSESSKARRCVRGKAWLLRFNKKCHAKNRWLAVARRSLKRINSRRKTRELLAFCSGNQTNAQNGAQAVVYFLAAFLCVVRTPSAIEGWTVRSRPSILLLRLAGR